MSRWPQSVVEMSILIIYSKINLRATTITLLDPKVHLDGRPQRVKKTAPKSRLARHVKVVKKMWIEKTIHKTVREPMASTPHPPGGGTPHVALANSPSVLNGTTNGGPIGTVITSNRSPLPFTGIVAPTTNTLSPPPVHKKSGKGPTAKMAPVIPIALPTTDHILVPPLAHLGD